jgi:hypothetical protein
MHGRAVFSTCMICCGGPSNSAVSSASTRLRSVTWTASRVSIEYTPPISATAAADRAASCTTPTIRTEKQKNFGKYPFMLCPSLNGDDMEAMSALKGALTASARAAAAAKAAGGGRRAPHAPRCSRASAPDVPVKSHVLWIL